MHASVTVTPAQLPELLLHVAVVRPVLFWGQPGIGKSSLVEEFATQVGLECHTLLGTQLAAEDLIGVPRIVGEGERARSRFCPPEAIARDEPYVLFLDELNGSSHEVQKAFYSLILDRRLGNYSLHPESVVIGAGNRSQDWFISSYPLLGALAAAFKLVEDSEVCHLHGIRVAAISPAAAELYVNTLCGLEDSEHRFVIAHELLHGLRHDTRGGGRDPWLWNVACDYVINGWLAEMAVGDLVDSALYDPSLRGKSAEEVYDEIAAGRRRTWKLATLRGPGTCDILPRRLAGPDDPAWGVDLDEFYRRCLADGIDYHRGQGRGLLPAGLVEEIRALTEPPVPWDVELARWFDDHFVPVERRRSYARASRRQSATPAIPRPGWHLPEELMQSRTFGVVLDTSGSMDRRLLGKALGAIASYAVTRDVQAVRVVFCDAEAHDNGWMHPLDIAGRVRIRGRGGTVLQPGIDLLQDAPDFPNDGPILIITDAWIEPGPDKTGSRVPDPGRSRPPLSGAGTGVPLLLRQ